MSCPPSEYDTGPLVDRVMAYRGRNSRYFKIARKAALCSESPDYKHGAVLVKGGSVMSCSGPEISGVMPISFHLTAAGRCCRAAI